MRGRVTQEGLEEFGYAVIASCCGRADVLMLKKAVVDVQPCPRAEVQPD